MPLEKKLRDRYSRQTMFAPIGEEGQMKLLSSRVAVIGCGALGCVISTYLARAGVGHIRIVDRDLIEVHNLHRQVLFDEDDVRQGLPKAVAAERHLRRVNSTVEVTGVVADLNYTNIQEMCGDANVIVDGLDNLETRFLINDFALKHRIPWVYGGAVGASGMTMNVIPGETACFRCLNPVTPPPGTTATCETAGVVGTVPGVIAAIETTETIKLLLGSPQASRKLLLVDAWTGVFEYMAVAKRDACPACNGAYEHLSARHGTRATSLCGQTRAIQVFNPETGKVNLEAMERRLEGVSNVRRYAYMLQFDAGNRQVSVFPDGRAIIKNTLDEEEAKAVYRRFLPGKG